jgi:hypothetical protein
LINCDVLEVVHAGECIQMEGVSQMVSRLGEGGRVYPQIT